MIKKRHAIFFKSDTYHSTYSWIIKWQKCARMGLNDFHIELIIGTHCNWKKLKILGPVLELPAKGQLISKATYGVLDSPKNERKRFDLIYHSSNKSNFFIFLFVFLGEVRKTKIAFEIIWPLLSRYVYLCVLALCMRSRVCTFLYKRDLLMLPDHIFERSTGANRH